MLRIKSGVRIGGLRPEMLFAIVAVNEVCRDAGVDCVVTSASEGTHNEGSLHFVGQAVDFRTRDMAEPLRGLFADNVQGRLGYDYDVVLEKTHLHVEFQPTRGINS